MTSEPHRGPGSRRSVAAILACVLGIGALAALDLGTKAWALGALSVARPGEPPPVCDPDEHGRQFMQRLPADVVTLVPGYLELRYAENCGAAFGLLRDANPIVRRGIFGLAAAVAGVALMWMFVQGRGGTLFAWSVPFIVSGAVGNLVDRMRLGYVVDFIRLHLQDGPSWPTFNVADAAITVGVVLLLLDGLREGRREAQEAAAPGGAGEQPETRAP
jgi:signal peptidase II